MKSKFSEVLDIVQSKEFWQKAKCLVELSAPAMNLQLDWSCAYKVKAGILQNETVWANAAKMPP